MLHLLNVWSTSWHQVPVNLIKSCKIDDLARPPRVSKGSAPPPPPSVKLFVPVEYPTIPPPWARTNIKFRMSPLHLPALVVLRVCKPLLRPPRLFFCRSTAVLESGAPWKRVRDSPAQRQRGVARASGVWSRAGGRGVARRRVAGTTKNAIILPASFFKALALNCGCFSDHRRTVLSVR